MLNSVGKRLFSIKSSPLAKTLFELNVKGNKLPAFQFDSSQIEILDQPIDFYLALLVGK